MWLSSKGLSDVDLVIQILLRSLGSGAVIISERDSPSGKKTRLFLRSSIKIRASNECVMYFARSGSFVGGVSL